MYIECLGCTCIITMDTEEYSHLTCTIHLLLKFKISSILHQQIILLLFNVSEFLVDILTKIPSLRTLWKIDCQISSLVKYRQNKKQTRRYFGISYEASYQGLKIFQTFFLSLVISTFLSLDFRAKNNFSICLTYLTLKTVYIFLGFACLTEFSPLNSCVNTRQFLCPWIEESAWTILFSPLDTQFKRIKWNYMYIHSLSCF